MPPEGFKSITVREVTIDGIDAVQQVGGFTSRDAVITAMLLDYADDIEDVKGQDVVDELRKRDMR